jgi:hypothetical protein
MRLSRTGVIGLRHFGFDPLHHAAAGTALARGLRMPLPFASATRIAASFVASILARPIGLPLLVPFSRALTSPAWMRS